MRTLHNTIINPTYWNKALRALWHCRAFYSGRQVLSSYFDGKSQPSNLQKDKNPPKRNTVHHPVSLNTEYSKAGLA
ncbi:MAG: hypothetical protein HWD63_02585 [Candidatus Parvibacillus calidus]|nr:MAG: hypothetical protein HWD63_02585 [Candidatus Parvibacillus calidus]